MIQTDLRNGMFGHTDDEYERGKLPLQLRRKFLRYAATPRPTGQSARLRRRRRQVLGQRLVRRQLRRHRQAIQRHVDRVHRVDRRTPVGAGGHLADLQGSTVRPRPGATRCVIRNPPSAAHRPVRGPRRCGDPRTSEKDFHFDAWYDGWKAHRAPGSTRPWSRSPRKRRARSLAGPARTRADTQRRTRSAELRTAVLTRCHGTSNRWRAASASTSRGGPRGLRRGRVAAVRNAHVYLAAALWAGWARDRRNGGRTATTGRSWTDSAAGGGLRPRPTRAHLRGMPRAGQRGALGPRPAATSCSTTSTRWWSSTATAAGSPSCSRWSAAPPCA